MQAVVLAGGFGTRLSHVISSVPKPMAPIGKIPFLKYLYGNLKLHGVDNFLFLTGYKSEVIEQYFSDYSDVKIIKESNPLGTGGALLNAFEYIENKFFLINGDTFFDIDLSIFQEFSNNKPLTISLRFTDNVYRYGFVEIDEAFRVNSFIEKGNLPSNKIDGYINGGIYCISKSLLSISHKESFGKLLSFENDLLPIYIQKGFVYGLPLGGMFIDIGIPEDYFLSQTIIPIRVNQILKPALFIDKDGTLIEDSSYVSGPNIEVIKSTVSIVQKYKAMGFYLVMVTNQSGIAKNKFSYDDMMKNINSITEYYRKLNIEFDDIEYCPYHEDATNDNYRFCSLLRKPSPGMILRACEKLKIDLKNSVMIGDNKIVDVINLPYLKSEIIE